MLCWPYGIRRRPLCSFGRNNFQGAKIRFLQQENGLLVLKGHSKTALTKWVMYLDTEVGETSIVLSLLEHFQY